MQNNPWHKWLLSVVPPTLVFLLLVVACEAMAEVEFRWGGRLQSDLRFRIESKKGGEWYNEITLPDGVSRNENIFKLKFEAETGRFAGVADIDFVWMGYSPDVESFGDLFRREKLDAFRLEAHAAYVDATGLFVDGLDVRIGYQVVAWGVGDQFNPTNNLNALDLEDPLLFGEQLANAMVRMDYSPKGDWILSGVLVPVFKPALLPASAQLGIGAIDRLPFADQSLRQRIEAEQALAKELGYPAVVTNATPVLPDISLENMQFSFRMAGVVADQDIALSYYYGRTDIPQPWMNYTHLNSEQVCGTVNGEKKCLKGIAETEVSLGYPRMQVLGVNMSGQVNPFKWISKNIRSLGYRLELGVFFPQKSSIVLYQDDLDFGFITMPSGEYPYGYGQGVRPLTIDGTPFAKWVLGLDYTFGQHFYVNTQWVHGFPDEFGAGDFFREGWVVVRSGVNATRSDQILNCALIDPKGNKCATELLRPRQGDYLVVGADIKFFDERALIRLFFILDMTGIFEESWDAERKERVRTHYSAFSSEGFSAVVFPEFTYNFGHGFELSAGAMFKLGKEHTKFGDPAAGGSEIWTRARFAY
ncbi:MAG: hypothetical protein V1754_03135 [Pseudomonadota bacterium]